MGQPCRYTSDFRSEHRSAGSGAPELTDAVSLEWSQCGLQRSAKRSSFMSRVRTLFRFHRSGIWLGLFLLLCFASAGMVQAAEQAGSDPSTQSSLSNLSSQSNLSNLSSQSGVKESQHGAFASTALSSATSPTEMFGMTGYFRMIWGLLLVLGIMLLIYGLVRKKFSLLNNGSRGEIKVKEVKPLMGKKALCLVEVRGTTLLLGLSGDRIERLATLAPLDDRQENSFAEHLQRSTQHSTQRNTYAQQTSSGTTGFDGAQAGNSFQDERQ